MIKVDFQILAPDSDKNTLIRLLFLDSSNTLEILKLMLQNNAIGKICCLISYCDADTCKIL